MKTKPTSTSVQFSLGNPVVATLLLLAPLFAAGCGGSGEAEAAKQEKQGASKKTPATTDSKPAAPQKNRMEDLANDSFQSLHDAVAAMNKAAKERDAAMRLSIAQWIAKNHGMNAVPTMEQIALDVSQSLEARVAACDVLRYVGPPAADSLIKLVDADQSLVAVNALKSIVMIRPTIPNLLERLIAWVDHQELHVQRAAIQSLARIGPQAESAGPKLLAILNNPDANETLRSEAKKALKKVNPRRTFAD